MVWSGAKVTVIALAVIWTAGAAVLFFIKKPVPPAHLKYPAEENVKTAPQLKPGVAAPELTARSALSIFVDGDGEPQTLFEKNGRERLPVASIAKLMTALVAIESFPPEDAITFSKTAIAEQEGFGEFKPGESFSAGELMHSLLMESSNDAAAAFAETVGRSKFVELMNKKAGEMGLENTRFTNPTGLDAGDGGSEAPYSTAEDVLKLARYIKENRPEIFSILAAAEYDLRDTGGRLHHKIKNTDELLSRRDWGVKIIGGKTGETTGARQTLLLVVESPRHSGYIMSVILRSEDRFGDMKTLVDWDYNSYVW